MIGSLFFACLWTGEKRPCHLRGGKISEEVKPPVLKPRKVIGYLPTDTPPFGAMLSVGFQQFLTIFSATVRVFEPIQPCKN
jgi:hypothetical protein